MVGGGGGTEPTGFAGSTRIGKDGKGTGREETEGGGEGLEKKGGMLAMRSVKLGQRKQGFLENEGESRSPGRKRGKRSEIFSERSQSDLLSTRRDSLKG